MENPPLAVVDLNERGFETAALAAHAKWGVASAKTLNVMLAEFGFPE